MILGVDNEFHRRVNVVLNTCARCIRILFADGYEIDILGDPTREAHGTNKRRGTAESFVQISSAFCYGALPRCESKFHPEMRSRPSCMLQKLL